MPLNDVSINIKDTTDFRFFELRKIKICEPLPKSFIHSIALSNEIIFIATNEGLRIIVAKLITDFEWNNKVTQQIIENYPSVFIPLSIKANFVTTSGGKNSILTVFGPLIANPNQHQIQFFDLTDLNVVNSELQPFSVIDLPSPLNQAEIINLDWHPEFNESLFIAILSTGALISVGVNLPKKQSRIICVLAQNDAKITCASWSPKGKQFVIGKENGQIIQIKHKDGSNFEEAKKIEPDQELIGYEVNSIKWCFTHLLMTSYAKLRNESEFDVKHITLFTKGQTIQFNNHGSLCIENFNKDLKYKTDFVHLGSVILCSTSYSPEIAVLVCDDIEKNVNSWYQVMLLDNSRVELPITLNGTQTLSKGMIMYFGNERKMFKISDSEVIGGHKFPLMMIINSEGVLCNFYASYSLEGKLTDPVVYPTKQLEFQFVPQQQQAISNQPPAFHQQTPTKQYPVPQQAQQQANLIGQQQQQPQQQQVVQLTNEQIQQIKQIQQAQKALQEQEKLIAQQKQAAKEAELQKEKERRQIIEENHAYLIAIEEEVFQFTKLICESKNKYSKSNSQIVGKEEEKRSLVQSTESLENELNQASERLNGLDVELLENFLLENLAMAADAKSRVERDNDSKLNTLFKKKPLDALTERKLKDINNKKIYIETNLKEIDYILDQQWHEYVVSEKGKKIDSVPPLSLIYQTITNNNRTLTSLENQLRAVEPVLPWKDPNHKLSYKKQEIKKLTSKLSRAKLDETEFDNVSYENGNDYDDDEESDLVEIKRFTKENQQHLKRILDARPEIPRKRSSLPVDINSSIMVSAISKAKEKLKSAKKQIEKNQMKQALARNQLAATNKKQIDFQQQQQHQQIQKSPQANRHPQQIKATSTFMPPSISHQANIVPQSNKSPQLPPSQTTQAVQKQLMPRQVVPTKTPIQQNFSTKLPQQTTIDKPLATPQPLFNPAVATVSKGEPFKFSFDGNLGIDKSKPITFGQTTDQNKATTQLVPKQQPSIKATTVQLPTSTTAGIFTAPQQPEQKAVDFQFKSTADQLNLTFEKSGLNLMSSTPIKTNQLTDQQAQQLQRHVETSVALANKANTQPLFSNSATLNQLNKVKETATSNVDFNKTTEDAQNVVKPAAINQPKYEDVSPANTPTIDLKQQQKTPVTSNTATKSNDPAVFSFDALAAISKMPVSSVFSSNTTPLFGQAITPTTAPLSNKTENLQNVQNNNQQQVQNKTEVSTTSTASVSTTTSSMLSTSKTIFGQPLATSPLSSASNQPLSFGTQGSTSMFAPKEPQTTTTSIFGTSTASTVQQPTTLFGKPIDTSGGFKFGSTIAPTLSTTSSTTAQSTMSTTTPAFSMNLTSGFMNLASPKKDTTNQFTTSSNLSAQQPAASLSTQQSLVSSQSSIFSSATSTTAQSPLNQQQPSAFSSFSMCSLGGKPNPENANKNPFGSPLAAGNTSSTGLFGSSQQQPQQQSLFSSQPTSPAFATSASSPFSTTTSQQPSTFGSTSVFGQQQPQTSVFNSPMKSVFGQQPNAFAQTTSPMSSGFGQQSQFGQPSAFGSKSTFGQSPNASFGSNATMNAPGFSTTQPVFGANSSIASQNASFSSLQAPQTGFNSFSNAPTFGSAAMGNSSFESIAQNTQTGFSAFGNVQGNQFGSPQNQQPQQPQQFGGSQFSERRA